MEVGDCGPFDFELRTQIRFGHGRVQELSEIVEDRATTVAVVVDDAVVDLSAIETVLTELREGSVDTHVFPVTVREPSYTMLDSLREEVAGPDYDYVVGIGGGSSMDLAKGVATLLRNEGPALSYRGFPELDTEPVPVVAVPTTAGTGSEVTFNAVFTETGEEPKENRKLGINSRHNYPTHAIVDPSLTVSCPEQVTVSAGMDALVHTLESFAASSATPTSQLYSRKAFDYVFNALGQVVDNRADDQARSKLSMGANYAGAALVNSGAGPAGAMSYPLGSVFDVPHGIAGGTFLPETVRYNVEQGYTGYHTLYNLIDGADTGLSKREKSYRFADAVAELRDEVGVPRKLDEFGITHDDVEFISRRTCDDLGAALEENPVVIGESEIKRILSDKLE